MWKQKGWALETILGNEEMFSEMSSISQAAEAPKLTKEDLT